MTAYVFPGQGSQFAGMGREEFDSNELAKELIQRADEVLGYKLSDVMFNGSDDDLKQTRITQPAIFLHSIMRAKLLGDNFNPSCVAGHSLGEYSALVASGAMGFEDGLKLVKERAEAMQEACEMTPGTMAAIVGLEDNVVEDMCNSIDGVVVAANYNTPGQLVISGEVEAVKLAAEKLSEAGARRAIVLEVGGAFHSPLMAPAGERLQSAIEQTEFSAPSVPVYQNVSATAERDPDVIKKNLVAQLTSPVRWTQTMRQMIEDGTNQFVEVGGKGRILAGMVKRLDRSIPTESI